MKRPSRMVRGRRGVVMALFAILLFAMLPMMALVIDLSYVNVTRRQMQAAAHTAAVEGLRQRDASSTDEVRREAVNQVLQTLGTDETLQLNAAENRSYGDMVAVEPVSGFDINTGTLQETSDYTRPDYQAVSESNAKTAAGFLVRYRRTLLSSQSGSIDNETNVSSGGPLAPYLFSYTGQRDFTATYDTAQDGYPVRATAIAAAKPALTVGPATPANAFSGSSAAIDGLAPLALSKSFWNNLTTGTATSVSIDVAGNINTDQGQLYSLASLSAALDDSAVSLAVNSTTGWPIDPNNNTALAFTVLIDNELLRVVDFNDSSPANWTVERGYHGTTAASHSSGARTIRHEVMTVGQWMDSTLRTVRQPLDALSTFPSEEKFVPIYDTVGSSGQRVIGFGMALIQRDATQSNMPNTLSVSITRKSSIIPLQNASAQLGRALPTDWASSADVNTLFSAVSTVAEPLKAPALVRTVGRLQ